MSSFIKDTLITFTPPGVLAAISWDGWNGLGKFAWLGLSCLYIAVRTVIAILEYRNKKNKL